MTYTTKDFDKLKTEKFTGCCYGKTNFTNKRYLSKDKKVYITCDDGFNYTMVYTASEAGKGKLLHDVYHQGNHSGYPIYTLESAIEKINKLNLELNFTFKVHESHFA